jgi:predicted transposase YdaD
MCEEDTHCGEKRTTKSQGIKNGMWERTVTEDEKGKGKEQGKANGKEKGIVKPAPVGDEISRAIALQMQKEMSEADLDMNDKLEQGY